MTFLERLRKYLLLVAGGTSVSRTLFEPDEAWVQKQVIDNLDELARSNTCGAQGRKELFDDLISRREGLPFVERIVELLQDGFLRGAPAEEVERYAAAGLANKMGLGTRGDSEARSLLLEHVCGEAQVSGNAASRRPSWAEIRHYARECLAVRKDGGKLALTPIGRVSLELTGRDAVIWLLSVESSLSLGLDDAFRLSRAGAKLLIKRTPWVFDWSDDTPARSPAWETLHRLRAFGVLEIEEDDGRELTAVTVTELGRQALRVCSDEQNPMSVLAATHVQDEALFAARRGAGPGVLQAPSASAEATARQARMVAHEIRNALVPAKTALSGLYKDLAAQRIEAALARRPLIDAGMSDVFRFIEELVRLAALGATPPEPFDPVSAIGDALSEVSASSANFIAPEGPLPLIEGHRHRAVFALVNVLRNAVRAVEGKSPPVIEVCCQTEPGQLCILVDDNGVGVPEDQRQAIFLEGCRFSLVAQASG